MSIGSNIRRIRLSKGLTQQQLGDLCVPQMAGSAIRRYEADRANPKMITIARIAKALNVPFGAIDTKYSLMQQDIESISVLKEQLDKNLQQFSGNAKELRKIEELQHLAQQAMDIIAHARDNDQEMFSILKDCEEIRAEIDNMLLEDFHVLNEAGQKKVIGLAAALSVIPEYRADGRLPADTSAPSDQDE